MMWLFKSPERAKLTGGLASFVVLVIIRILCTKYVDIILPIRAVESAMPNPG